MRKISKNTILLLFIFTILISSVNNSFAVPIVTEPTKKELNFSDLDLKKIAKDTNAELAEEKTFILEDLRILWKSAVEKSETIRFAILKLSNPDGDKEKKNFAQTILTPLASVAPLVGAGTGNPIAESGSFVGGGILGSLLVGNSALNAQLSRVTDTDLVILAQEIDNLQQKLVILYYDYVNSIEQLNLIDKIVQNRYKYYNAAQNSSLDTLAVADVFYRESLGMQFKARQEVLNSRAALEQFVQSEDLALVDQNIKKRFQN